jgi:hypothetical protein
MQILDREDADKILETAIMLQLWQLCDLQQLYQRFH